MESRVQRSFAVRASDLRLLSTWWREWVTAAGASPSLRDQGEIVLNEVAGNIVQHGCAREIRVALEATPETVRATVADDGPMFDPTRHPKRVISDPTDGGIGGRGIPLMHLYAAVSYARAGTENVLTLTFRR